MNVQNNNSINFLSMFLDGVTYRQLESADSPTRAKLIDELFQNLSSPLVEGRSNGVDLYRRGLEVERLMGDSRISKFALKILLMRDNIDVDHEKFSSVFKEMEKHLSNEVYIKFLDLLSRFDPFRRKVLIEIVLIEIKRGEYTDLQDALRIAFDGIPVPFNNLLVIGIIRWILLPKDQPTRRKYIDLCNFCQASKISVTSLLELFAGLKRENLIEALQWIKKSPFANHQFILEIADALTCVHQELWTLNLCEFIIKNIRVRCEICRQLYDLKNSPMIKDVLEYWYGEDTRCIPCGLFLAAMYPNGGFLNGNVEEDVKRLKKYSDCDPIWQYLLSKGANPDPSVIEKAIYLRTNILSHVFYHPHHGMLVDYIFSLDEVFRPHVLFVFKNMDPVVIPQMIEAIKKLMMLYPFDQVMILLSSMPSSKEALIFVVPQIEMQPDNQEYHKNLFRIPLCIWKALNRTSDLTIFQDLQTIYPVFFEGLCPGPIAMDFWERMAKIPLMKNKNVCECSLLCPTLNGRLAIFETLSKTPCLFNHTELGCVRFAPVEVRECWRELTEWFDPDDLFRIYSQLHRISKLIGTSHQEYLLIFSFLNEEVGVLKDPGVLETLQSLTESYLPNAPFWKYSMLIREKFNEVQSFVKLIEKIPSPPSDRKGMQRLVQLRQQPGLFPENNLSEEEQALFLALGSNWKNDNFDAICFAASVVKEHYGIKHLLDLVQNQRGIFDSFVRCVNIDRQYQLQTKLFKEIYDLIRICCTSNDISHPNVVAAISMLAKAATACNGSNDLYLEIVEVLKKDPKSLKSVETHRFIEHLLKSKGRPEFDIADGLEKFRTLMALESANLFHPPLRQNYEAIFAFLPVLAGVTPDVAIMILARHLQFPFGIKNPDLRASFYRMIAPLKVSSKRLYLELLKDLGEEKFFPLLNATRAKFPQKSEDQIACTMWAVYLLGGDLSSLEEVEALLSYNPLGLFEFKIIPQKYRPECIKLFLQIVKTLPYEGTGFLYHIIKFHPDNANRILSWIKEGAYHVISTEYSSRIPKLEPIFQYFVESICSYHPLLIEARSQLSGFIKLFYNKKTLNLNPSASLFYLSPYCADLSDKDLEELIMQLAESPVEWQHASSPLARFLLHSTMDVNLRIKFYKIANYFRPIEFQQIFYDLRREYPSDSVEVIYKKMWVLPHFNQRDRSRFKEIFEQPIKLEAYEQLQCIPMDIRLDAILALGRLGKPVDGRLIYHILKSCPRFRPAIIQFFYNCFASYDEKFTRMLVSVVDEFGDEAKTLIGDANLVYTIKCFRNIFLELANGDLSPSKNPFEIIKMQQAFSLSSPSLTRSAPSSVQGRSLCFDAAPLKDFSRQNALQRSDLRRSSIGPNTLVELFQGIEARMCPDLEAYILQATGCAFKDLKSNFLLKSYLQGVYSAIFDEKAPIDIYVTSLFDIIDFVASRDHVVPSSPTLSLREETLIRASCSINACADGQKMGILRYHQLLPTPFQTVRVPKEEGVHFMPVACSVFQGLIAPYFATSFLSSLGITNPDSHDGSYVLNFLAAHYGISHLRTFEYYPNCISNKLVEYKPDELFKCSLNHMPLEACIAKFNETVGGLLRENKIKYNNLFDFIELLLGKNKEPGWVPMHIVFDDPDGDMPIPLGLTFEGALLILKGLGLIVEEPSGNG